MVKDVGTESLENFVHTSDKSHIRLEGRETVLPCALCVTNDSISSSKAGNSLHLQVYDNTGVCLLQNLTYTLFCLLKRLVEVVSSYGLDFLVMVLVLIGGLPLHSWFLPQNSLSYVFIYLFSLLENISWSLSGGFIHFLARVIYSEILGWFRLWCLHIDRPRTLILIPNEQ